MLAVYIGTKNDTNGNPRRGWILFDAHGVANGFIDEGYEGSGALRSARVTATHHRIEVTPGEYRYWKGRRVLQNARKVAAVSDDELARLLSKPERYELERAIAWGDSGTVEDLFAVARSRYGKRGSRRRTSRPKKNKRTSRAKRTSRRAR